MEGHEEAREIRDRRAAMHKLKSLDWDSSNQEKEYYFDEGVGVSLDEHIKKVKENYPGARIQTRRDREGFAIVKVSHMREYKYDLNAMMSVLSNEGGCLDAADVKEALLRQLLPADDEAKLQSISSPESLDAFSKYLQG